MLDFTIADHVAVLASEGALMRAAVARGDLDGVVPSCPDWTVRELARHLGRVHRWAAANVELARPTPLTDEEQEAAWGAMPSDGELADWYRDAHARLISALTAAPADIACWSFLPAPSPLAFWARRQAHETAIHRIDAQQATGAVDPVPADFALDGIDELLCGFYGRPGRRLRSEQTPGAGGRGGRPAVDSPHRRGWSAHGAGSGRPG